MFNYQAITFIFAFRFVSLRFCDSFALRLHCLNLSKNIAFWPLFWPSRAFSCRLCVFVCSNTKGRYFGRFCASIFDAPPAPYRPPPRPRLPFRIIFFIFFSFSLSTLCLPAFKIFFRNFFFAFYLTANSYSTCYAIYVSENEEVFYLTTI